MEYRFEILNDDRINDLPILFKDAFNEDRDINAIKGKYVSYLSDGKKFTVIAYDSENRPAGLYAIFPFYATLNNKKKLIGQVGDILVHSLHRKSSNLFVNMGNHAHEYAKRNGMELLFAFVYGTKGSYPILTRYFDFIDPEKFYGYTIKIPTLPLSRWTKQYPVAKILFTPYLKWLKQLSLKKRDYFIHTGGNKTYGEIIKDKNYIDYKRSYSSANIAEVGGVRFLLKENKDGSWGIGDVDNNSIDDIKKAIDKLKFIAFLSGVRVLQFEISEGHILDQVLSTNYKEVQNRRLIYLNLSNTLDPNQLKFTYSDLDTY